MRVTGVEVATGHNKILSEIGGQTEKQKQTVTLPRTNMQAGYWRELAYPESPEHFKKVYKGIGMPDKK